MFWRGLSAGGSNQKSACSTYHLRDRDFEYTYSAGRDFGHFAIVYAGTFYPPKRSIQPLMKSLAELMSMRADRMWYFHYYGDHLEHVRHASELYGVTERVILHGRTPRSEVLSALKGAGCAVAITSILGAADDADNGIITNKVFDAMGLGTPTLLIAPPNSDVRKMFRNSDLIQTFNGNDVRGMAAFLAALMEKNASGKPLTEYAWPTLASELDGLLRRTLPI